MQNIESIFQEKFRPERFETIRNHLENIDNTKILGKRTDELAITIDIADHIYSKLGKKFKEIKLFEAGNNPMGGLDIGLYTHNIGFFFNNHPEFLKYKGYDPTYSKSMFEEEHYVPMQRKRKIALDERKLIKKALENQALEYEDFEKSIKETEHPVIFSTYVIGIPDLTENKRGEFWKLPGIHVHTFLVADLMMRWVEKNHPIEYELARDTAQGRIKIDELANVEKVFLSKNNNISADRTIKNLCTELYNTPSHTKYTKLDTNHATITYYNN